MASEIRVNSLTNRSGLSTVTIADTGAVVAGMITATTFSGPLTGAVTGNVTGNLTGNVTGNVTGNSDTASNLTGSPSITVTDITTTGNVSVGGTLTYEDVTNIDSVGIITAQSDVLIGRNLSVTSGISTFKSLDYAAIDSTISDTAVDVFIYDTSKDSDGGAWRKRTQHTSWYNETLGTATRGTRKEFPAVAVIVAESDKVTIYDGDDPDLPMWMVFNSQSFGLFNNNNSGHTILSVAALNGVLCGGGNSYSCVGIVNFVADVAFKQSANSATYAGSSFRGKYFGNIAQRHSALGFDGKLHGYSGWVVSDPGNDVAMTVLPNAPIDPDTGLPVPTIAVATNGGISVIKDDGTVVDITNGIGNTEVAFIDGGNRLMVSRNTQTAVETGGIPTADIAASSWRHTYYNDSSVVATLGSDNAKKLAKNTSVGGNSGLSLIDENLSSATNGLVAYATTSYNTGWMQGDIKGAFLSDTDTTNVTVGSAHYTETFTGSGDNTWGLAGSATISGGVLTLADAADSRAADLTAASSLTTGQKYIAEIEIVTNTSQVFKLDDDGSGAGQGSVTIYGSSTSGQTGTFLISFTKTGSPRMRFIRLSGGPATITSFKIYTAEEADRSVNNNGLKVFGTVTKSAVATGADLVAYSGFSASNYLEQPYNSDLNFGTGDFSFISWVKHPNTFASNQHSHIISKINPESSGQFTIQYETNSTLYLRSGATSHTNTGALSTNVWQQIAFVRRSGVLYGYKDGNLIASSNFSDNISNNESLRVGYRNSGYAGSWPGSLALLRISGSAPSAEQVKKIYEDEKVLFQENAKATLYGSSDAVTALAFDDDTDLLHVGTSSGRSDFQGLCRINNNTTAVTTAITAQNEFIIEQ